MAKTGMAKTGTAKTGMVKKRYGKTGMMTKTGMAGKKSAMPVRLGYLIDTLLQLSEGIRLM